MAHQALRQDTPGVTSGDLRGFMLNDMVTTDEPRASRVLPEGKGLL
jgi:hypothetical protein